jgi:hypothetical protein
LLLFSSLLIISSLPINHHDYHPPSGFGSPSCPCGTHASLTTLGTPQYSVHHSTVTVNGPSSRPTGLPQTPADAHVSPALSDSRRRPPPPPRVHAQAVSSSALDNKDRPHAL